MDKISKNFNKVLKSFLNKWVATSGDYGKVFASSSSLKRVMGKIKGKSDLKIFLVTPLGYNYSPISWQFPKIGQASF